MAITDEKSAKDWLEGKPRDVQVAFAARAALRYLPWVATGPFDVLSSIDLQVLRWTFISVVRGTVLTSKKVGKSYASSPAISPPIAAPAFYAAVSANYACLCAEVPENSLAFSVSAVAALDESQAAITVGSKEITVDSTDITIDMDSARSAANAAWAACDADANLLDQGDPEALFREPLWHRADLPEGLDQALGTLRTFWDKEGATRDFWARWYEGMLTGTPMNWDLQLQVARIPEDIWEAGPDAVAQAIAKIEEKFEEQNPLPEEAAKAQVKQLLQRALVSEMSARGLQQSIQMALDAYRREISNGLPEELEPLEQLPPILDHIALLLAGDTPQPEKEAQLYDLIQTMARTINELNRRLSDAKAGLAIAACTDELDRGRIFAEAFYKKAGEGLAGLITSKVLWGSVVAGGSMFLGGSADALVDTLAQCVQDVIEPNAIEAMGHSGPPTGAKFLKPPE